MRVSIQQPYFFPYPGYFALLSQIDVLVVLTDVQFQRRGWVNRNRIPDSSSKMGWNYFRIPVAKAPRDQHIRHTKVSEEVDWKTRFANQLRNSYGESGFEAAKSWGVEELLNCQDDYLLPYLMSTLNCTMHKLGIDGLEILDSSKIELPPNLVGSDKILALCELLGATHYWNLPGGKELYSHEHFAKRGISLNFVKDTRHADQTVAPWSVLHAICSREEKKLHNTIQQLI